MENWKQYILSMIFCALSCTILSQILADTISKALLHLICGTILAIVILRPLSEVRLEDFLFFPSIEMDEADFLTNQGINNGSEARVEYIKASCEAYILDKANSMGAEIQIKISLDENQIPAFAEIEGSFEPEIQMQLQTILADDLGIPKENQTWISNQESNSS